MGRQLTLREGSMKAKKPPELEEGKHRVLRITYEVTLSPDEVKVLKDLGYSVPELRKLFIDRGRLGVADHIEIGRKECTGM